LFYVGLKEAFLDLFFAIAIVNWEFHNSMGSVRVLHTLFLTRGIDYAMMENRELGKSNV